MACQQIDHKIYLAYKHCLNIAKKHYENFPVASKILPRNMRKPIAAIYAFARTADDVADEGNLNQEQRLEKLNFLQQQVNIMPDLITEDYVLLALQDTLGKHAIPKNLLIDLLTAFKQDVTKQEYTTFSEVLEYCKYSANPIGRLLLHLSGNALESNHKLSDKICTGLQLINFLQDVQRDLKCRGRCYIPTVDLNYFSVTAEQLKKGLVNSDVRELFLQQHQRVQDIYLQGIKLGDNLKGLFGIEIRMIITGGKYILDRLGARTDPYFRPVLTKLDKLKIFFKATIGKRT